MEFYKALLATVLGTEDQAKAAKEYLAEIDPDIWGQEE
jgi:hypothetical protein